MAAALRRQRALIVLALALTLVAAATPDHVLVRYSFDDDDVDTGPDTFAVFERAKGSVKLSSTYRFSGYRSVELRDAAGDGDFPELQGYFARRRTGQLFAHFAMLTTDADDLLNIALAGPKWFTLGKDGIGFWLKSEGGFLWQVSDSMPQKLFALRAFVWYVVDVAYDIDRGVYDLTIREEGKLEPVVSLAHQPNAANQPGSAVDKFSFVTDPFTDRSNLTYYVDDVVIGTDRAVNQLPFVAPGRRKLFVDAWVDHQKRVRARPTCLPVSAIGDVGVTAADVAQMERDGSIGLVSAALQSGHSPAPERIAALGDPQSRLLTALASWQEGCAALGKGRPAQALAHFDDALATVPEGTIYRLSRVLALAALRRWHDVDRELSVAYPDWQGDVRFALTEGMVGLARPDLDSASSWLREPAERAATEFGEGIPDDLVRRLWSGEIDRDLVSEFARRAPGESVSLIHHALVAEEYFFVLLWRGEYGEARRYATQMVERLGFLAAPQAQWLERAGDAAFLDRDVHGAREAYTRALDEKPDRPSVLAKLSDVAFGLGDLEGERVYRERIYGSLVRAKGAAPASARR
jgi:tetratricopeptide (TPR) repeat protein